MSTADSFSDAARRRGGAAALIWPDGSRTSFDALDRQSNQVARLLLARGVRKGDTVALVLDKSPFAYAAIIGCLKIGAPYFVIDPANPELRTRAMFARCRPVVMLRTGDETLLDGIDDAPNALAWEIEGADPAYVMFTSGSTGQPKGATMSHANLSEFMAWTRSEFETTQADVFSGVNPLFFDNSVFDLYASVFAGAALAPVPGGLLRQPAAMLAHLEAAGCTVFFSVPSLILYLQTLKLIDRHTLPALRTMVFGGEGFPKARLAELHDAIGDRVALLNVYGPTECTCIATAYRVTRDDLRDPAGLPPLGGVIANFTARVAAQDGTPVPDGEIGELWLGGPAVGLGYYGDPDQTARAFAGVPRMYRTGDLVRRDVADGKLYFAGRADSQIKHQGYRIELGEIEHALAALDDVREAAAVHLTGAGGSRIIGVVAGAGAPKALKARAAERLPAYMVPERIIVMETLPKNANGKVDRLAIKAAIERGDLA